MLSEVAAVRSQRQPQSMNGPLGETLVVLDKCRCQLVRCEIVAVFHLLSLVFIMSVLPI